MPAVSTMPERPLVPLQQRVHRIARRPGYFGDDHAIFTKQAIHQRRLAGVRPTDDRDRYFFLRALSPPALPALRLPGARPPVAPRRTRRVGGFQVLGDHFEQIANAVTVLGADLDDAIESEAREFEGGVAGAAIVGLVDGEDHRHAGIARGLGNVFVARDQSFAPVDDEHDEVGGLERLRPVRFHELVQRVLAGAEQAAGVGQLKMDPTPFHGMSNNVAGGAGDGRDDRSPRAAQTIEQRGLTHIRASDQHDLA